MQLLVALATLTLVLEFLLGVTVEPREAARLRTRVEQHYQNSLFLLDNTLKDAIVAEDSALLTALLPRIGEKDTAVISILVEDAGGQTLGSWKRKLGGEGRRTIEFVEPVDLMGDRIGQIRLLLDQEGMLAEVADLVLEMRLVLLGILLLVAIIVAALTYRVAISPLSRIDKQVRMLQQDQCPPPLKLRGAVELQNVGAAIDAFAESLHERERESRAHQEEMKSLNDSYRRFVPQQFLNNLHRESITNVEQGDQVGREMTILFSDIRNFTSLSEKVGAQATFDFINDYLRRLGPVIREHGGFIDKYIGDAIMALFERPSDALQASLGLMEALKVLNEARVAVGEEKIKIGIGIHTGPLMLGIIGEEERLEGTVIGDVVNLGSRLETLTKKYKVPILFSEDTLRAYQRELDAGLQTKVDLSDFRFVDSVQAKGRKALTPVYEMYGYQDVGKRNRKHLLKMWRLEQLARPFDARSEPSVELTYSDPVWPFYRQEVLGQQGPSTETTQLFIDDEEDDIVWH